MVEKEENGAYKDISAEEMAAYFQRALNSETMKKSSTARPLSPKRRLHTGKRLKCCSAMCRRREYLRRGLEEFLERPSNMTEAEKQTLRTNMAAATAKPGGKPEPSAAAEPYRPGQNIKKNPPRGRILSCRGGPNGQNCINHSFCAAASRRMPTQNCAKSSDIGRAHVPRSLISAASSSVATAMFFISGPTYSLAVKKLPLVNLLLTEMLLFSSIVTYIVAFFVVRCIT